MEKSMNCPKCGKQYKTAKTLEQHMKKMHNEDNDEVQAPNNTKEQGSNNNGSTNKNEEKEHTCSTCNLCKEDIKYLKEVSSLLIIRYVESVEFKKSVSDNLRIASLNFDNFKNKIDEHSKDIGILMTHMLEQKFIKEHNEKNPKEPITEKDIVIKTKKSK